MTTIEGGNPTENLGNTARIPQRNRQSENAADAGAFQMTAGSALLFPAGLIITLVFANPEIGIPLTVAGIVAFVRGIENHDKEGRLQRGESLPKIRERRFGRILYP